MCRRNVGNKASKFEFFTAAHKVCCGKITLRSPRRKWLRLFIGSYICARRILEHGHEFLSLDGEGGALFQLKQLLNLAALL
jgi:hypothetical protein